DVLLGDGVVRMDGRGRTYQQRTDVDVGAGQRVHHRHAGQRLVAGLGDHQDGADGLAGVGVDAVARRIDPNHLLVQLQRRVLLESRARAVGGRRLLFAFFCLRVVDPPRYALFPYTRLFRSDVLLGDGVVRMDGRGRTYQQRTDVDVGAGQRVHHRHAG